MLALIVAIIAVMLLLPSCIKESKNDLDQTTLVKAGDTAPDFSFEQLAGGTATLSGLRQGKVMLLTFWASWCPTCKEELDQVQDKIIDRFGGEEFIFQSIARGDKDLDVEEFREKIATFCGDSGYSFPVGLDPQQTAYNIYASKYVPRNILIGRDGIVIAVWAGYSDKEFNNLIETIAKTLE